MVYVSQKCAESSAQYLACCIAMIARVLYMYFNMLHGCVTIHPHSPSPTYSSTGSMRCLDDSKAQILYKAIFYCSTISDFTKQKLVKVHMWMLIAEKPHETAQMDNLHLRVIPYRPLVIIILSVGLLITTMAHTFCLQILVDQQHMLYLKCLRRTMYPTGCLFNFVMGG